MLHRFLDPPSETAIDSAVQMLIEVGALTKDEVLTPLGRHLANIPVELRLAKVYASGELLFPPSTHRYRGGSTVMQ